MALIIFWNSETGHPSICYFWIKLWLKQGNIPSLMKAAADPW